MSKQVYNLGIKPRADLPTLIIGEHKIPAYGCLCVREVEFWQGISKKLDALIGSGELLESDREMFYRKECALELLRSRVDESITMDQIERLPIEAFIEAYNFFFSESTRWETREDSIKRVAQNLQKKMTALVPALKGLISTGKDPIGN